MQPVRLKFENHRIGQGSGVASCGPARPVPDRRVFSALRALMAILENEYATDYDQAGHNPNRQPDAGPAVGFFPVRSMGALVSGNARLGWRGRWPFLAVNGVTASR